jgi:transposase
MDTPQIVRDLIIAHHEAGELGCRQIAALLKLSKSTVFNILKKYRETGSSHTTRSGRCGRRPLLTVRNERALITASKECPTSTARQIRERVGGHLSVISVSLVKKVLTKYGVQAIDPEKVPS